MSLQRPLREWGRWKEIDPASKTLLLNRGRAGALVTDELRAEVSEIVDDVRSRGDEAVVSATRKYDDPSFTADRLIVGTAEVRRAREQVAPEVLAAIRDSIEHIRIFNEEILSGAEWSREVSPGLRMGEKITPIASAGLFVPSGKASYPSVMMQLGVPARTAGVPLVAVVVPPAVDGSVDPAVLTAADELGISRIYRANGPAGVAALAFGTETIPAVRKILGPGSPAVVCAQLLTQAYGSTSINMMGPSESVILADGSAEIDLLAADLLNEAEHGPDSASVLVTDSPAILQEVQEEIAHRLAQLPEPRRGFAAKSLGENGGVVLVDDVREGAEVINCYAPEHLEILVEDPAAAVALIRNAGEILVGRWTPISSANFVLGCPAILPTGGFADVSSGVTVNAFVKRSAVVEADAAAFAKISRTAATLAEHEGFPAHREAILARNRLL
ncbi:histidinol dehydrogenase [Frankia sp. AiPs1]|uniref:histidinol dehydrogenase n=1 Tax=Frankia sp. AiPs1 TaxID=573493 RepID=UPI0020447678|nr:histidinol dehydrogenase [Frankia sp. AiPs1]MCM3922645.1 histidinol dehydrogenase [Frankia sp. AiPs1]